MKKEIRRIREVLNKVTLSELANDKELQKDLIIIRQNINDFFKMLNPKCRIVMVPIRESKK
jgi:hypothetical protein